MTAGDGVEIDDAHGFAVKLGGGYAEVALAKLVDAAVDEIALEYQVNLTVAGKVVVLGADAVNAKQGVAVFRCLEHVILVEVEHVDGEVRGQMEFLDSVDLVAHDVQLVDVLETEERVLVDDTEVGCLDQQVVHVSAGQII